MTYTADPMPPYNEAVAKIVAALEELHAIGFDEFQAIPAVVDALWRRSRSLGAPMTSGDIPASLTPSNTGPEWRDTSRECRNYADASKAMREALDNVFRAYAD